MCALFLEVPAQQVDVNVHPNKLEVRFQNEAAVAEAVRTLVGEAMRGETLGERLTAAQKVPSPSRNPKLIFRWSGWTILWIAGQLPLRRQTDRKAARDLRRTPNQSPGARR